MFGNLSQIFCRVVNSLLINMEIAVLKLVGCKLNLQQEFSCYKGSVALHSQAPRKGRGHFSNCLFLLYSISTLSLSFFVIFFPLQRTITLNHYFLVSSYLFDNKTPLYSRGLKLTYVLNANVGQNLNIYFFAIGETQVSKFMITNEFIPQPGGHCYLNSKQSNAKIHVN